jgi:hypothetical protein
MLFGMYLKINLFLSLCLLSSSLFAQSTISGRVYEKGTRNILKDVNVFILPHKLKATSNKEGYYQFENVPEGEFEFVINNSGYLKLSEKIKDKKESYDLYIEKEFYDVYETVVTGVKAKKDVTKKTLTQKEFLKAPGALGDPVKAIQNLPGVANQSFSSQVVIQGSEPDDTKYRLRGHEIPLVFHFGGLTSVVPPTAVESVDYLSSGYGPEYGRALGGIVNLNTRKPKTDRWHGEGFFDITKVGVLGEGPISEKSSIILSGRLSYFGTVLKKIAEEKEEFAVTSAPEFNDLYLQYNYKLGKDENFTFEAITSADTLEFIVKEGRDPKIEGDISNDTSFYRIIPRYEKKISDKLSLEASLGYGKDNIKFQVSDRYFDLENYSFSQIAELKYDYSKKLTTTFGIDSQYRDFSVLIRLPTFNNQGGVGTPGGTDIIGDIKGSYWESAFYIRNNYKYSDKLSFSPNLRFEYLSRINDVFLMPRLNSTYSINNSLDWNFATGTYYQAPKDGEPSKEFGNPNLKAEEAIHFYTSLVKDFRKGSNTGLILDTGIFYKKLNNLVIQTNELNTDGSPIRYSNNGEGNVYGALVQGNYKLDPFTFLASYTFLKSRRKDNINGDYPSRFDQTHNLNLIGIYERSRWSFSTRLRYVTGGPYTPVIGSIYNADRDVYLPTRGNFYSERFDDFFQLDFRIDRKFIYKYWILSAYLDIQNLTNSSNGQGISYNFDYSENKAAEGTPIFPIIGVRGEF